MKFKKAMDQETVIIECLRCGTKNRLPRARIQDRPHCGKCHAPLDVHEFAVRPLETTDARFAVDILAAAEPALVFFYSPTCPYCRMTKKYLEEHDVAYELTEVDLLEGDEKDAAVAEVVRLSGGKSFPVLDVDGQVVVGFNKGRMAQILDL